jgi:hypothetical protein
MLQNLATQIGEYEAGADSTSVFDYAKGNPFATTTAKDFLAHKGASFKFIGATPVEEQGVFDKF